MEKMKNQTYIDNKLTKVIELFNKGENDIRFYNEAIHELYKIFKYPRERWDKKHMLKFKIVYEYMKFFSIMYDYTEPIILADIEKVFLRRF